MHVDYLTLACLRDDLDDFVGGRVQQVVLPDPLSIGLELYGSGKGRHYLLLSAHAQQARIVLQPEKLRRGIEKETPLLLLLRKYLRGAHITGVFQPLWERLLDIRFESDAGEVRLIAEIMGKWSNLILVGADGRVLEAIKRIGPDVNRYRVTLPGKPYVPPPAQSKPGPLALDAAAWELLIARADPEMPLADLVRREAAAISPTLGREVAARAGGDVAAAVGGVSGAAVAESLHTLFAPLSDTLWSPSMARDEEGSVLAFAPYALTQFGEDASVVRPESISAAIADYWEHRLTDDAYAAARRTVAALIDDVRGRVAGIAHQLERQSVAPEEIEALREAGELLLAYQWQVQRGQREVTVPDYAGEPRTIVLDPTQTAVENANAYFRRYEKAKRASHEVPGRQTEVEGQLAYLDQLATDLALAENRAEIDAVRAALVEAGYLKEGPKRPKGSMLGGPLRLEIGGVVILVGRNSRQNEEVTFGRASGDDFWLHARGVPGAHVIVKRAGRTVAEEIVARAAELAAYYSRSRNNTEVAVDMTERRHVSRLKGGGPGLVTYRNEQTLHVAPRGPSDDDI